MIRTPSLSASAAAVLLALAPAAYAAPPIDVPIQNAGFEDPVLTDGTFGLGGVAPWSDFDAFGPINPPAFILTGPVPEGENVAFSNLDGDTAEQILDLEICDGDQLTLSVFVGARTDDLVFGGYIVGLEAVADDDTRTEIATVTSNDVGALVPPAGGFLEVTVAYTVDGDEFVGDRVAIKLGSFSTQPGQQTFFDDVRLTVQTNSIQVPDCVPTIQEALELAEDGDEIVLQPGYYWGPVDFGGKNVTIRSIDPDDEEVVNQTRITSVLVRGGEPIEPVEPLVSFTSGEGPGAGLLGVSLENPFDVVAGGNIFISGASPTIDRCQIYSGHADTFGGGAYVENGAPTFDGCLFAEHHAGLGGGALYLGAGSDAEVFDCEFFYAIADFGSGGAIHIAADADALIDGCDFGLNGAELFGGSIYVDSRGDVQIVDCEFLGKIGAYLGGAIFSFQSSPLVSGCEISHAGANEGGGMFAYGGSPTVVGCEFYNCEAFSGDLLAESGDAPEGARGIMGVEGGGGYAQHTGQATITGCLFEANTAGRGAGLASRGADIAVTNCQFIENYAAYSPGEGGGLNAAGGSIRLERSSFLNNHASNYAGGAYIDVYGEGGRGDNKKEPSEPLGDIINCVFDHNAAADGAGGMLVRGTGVNIANCTFSGNDVYNAFDGGRTTLSGGGVYVSSDPGDLDFAIFNCILWGNTPDQIFADNFFGPVTLANSNIQDGVPLGLDDAGGNIFTYPRFVDVNGLDNDPTTAFDNDLSLAMNSPCIDAGDTPSLLAIDVSGIDVWAAPRVVDDIGVADTGIADGGGLTVDMGAYEFQGASDPRCSPADLVAPFGELNFSDVLEFLDAFANKGVDADLSEEYGILDFSDVLVYITLFGEGCEKP